VAVVYPFAALGKCPEAKLSSLQKIPLSEERKPSSPPAAIESTLQHRQSPKQIRPHILLIRPPLNRKRNI
jgi:hypothetical protein